VMSWANATTSGAMSLGNVPMGAIAVYDRDGDGDEDVLLGDAAHSVVRVLHRGEAGYTLLTAPLLTGTAANDAGIGALCGGDLDGDGDGDVVAWNRGTMNVHTLRDALRSNLAPPFLAADVAGAAVDGGTVSMAAWIGLPGGVAAAQPAASSFLLQCRGWLADPVTGIVAPQRVVDLELPIAASWPGTGAQLAFALPAAHQGRFHLQLQCGVVAVLGNGERRNLPTTLLHATNDTAIEARVRAEVEQQRSGFLVLPGKDDGGGDGNILGTKTGKHVVGEPPQ